MPTDTPEIPVRPAEAAASPRDGAVREAKAGGIRSTRPRQVRPKTEGWQQAKGPDGRPLLQFASPKRGKPPAHLADLAPEEWKARADELG
ncbi:MAG TPA: 23S rRNA (adenine(2503)-C(2))-methyltransferase RlmN, partial [Agromyces sp.]